MKLYRLIITSLIIIFSSPAWADNFYVCTDGNGAGSTDGSSWANCYDGFDDIVWGGAGITAGDILYLRDDDGAYRETLTVGASGSSGNEITIKADTGESPVIKSTDAFNSWSLVGGETYLYSGTFTPGGSVDEFYGATKDNVRTKKYNIWDLTGDDWDPPSPVNDSTMVADSFYSSASSSTVYWRTSDGINPGEMEIGARLYGINLASYDYIIIDGIEIHGPGGDTSPYANTRALINIGSSNNITIQNSTVNFADHYAIEMNGTSGFIVIDNVDGNYNRQFAHMVGSSCGGASSMGDCVTIKNCYVTNSATVSADIGDRNGFFGCSSGQYLLFERNYFETSGNAAGEPPLDAIINTFNASDVEIKYNYFKDCGRNCVQALSNDSAPGDNNYWIHHNIFDEWGQRPGTGWSGGASGAVNGHCNAIVIGGGSDADAQVDNVHIYNNTFINGSGTSGVTTAPIYIKPYAGTDIEIKNNIIDDTANTYSLWINTLAGTSGWSVKNNDFYDTATNPIYDFGTPRTVAAFDSARAWASGNEDVDPQLDSNYYITSNSPSSVQSGGEHLSSYDIGLDEETIWSPLSVTTADWEDYVGANTQGMGAFVYDSQYRGNIKHASSPSLGGMVR